MIWTAIVGFVVGLIARAILPGAQSLGIILTALLGIAGSFLASFIMQSMGMGHTAGLLGSVVGAVVLLFVVGKVKGAGKDASTPSV